jgi:hypothetical protein
MLIGGPLTVASLPVRRHALIAWAARAVRSDPYYPSGSIARAVTVDASATGLAAAVSETDATYNDDVEAGEAYDGVFGGETYGEVSGIETYGVFDTEGAGNG